jgi:hypothetical protein
MTHSAHEKDEEIRQSLEQLAEKPMKKSGGARVDGPSFCQW